jgi:hypothetical protein
MVACYENGWSSKTISTAGSSLTKESAPRSRDLTVMGTVDEIRGAYRSKIRQCPPDRWEKGGAEFRVGATGLVPYLPIQLTETAYIPPPAEVLQGLPAEARALLERHAEVLQGLPAEARAWLERPCPPLAEVVQGPTAERALARDALERFLRGLGHDAKTRLSEAPLR